MRRGKGRHDAGGGERRRQSTTGAAGGRGELDGGGGRAERQGEHGGGERHGCHGCDTGMWKRATMLGNERSLQMQCQFASASNGFGLRRLSCTNWSLTSWTLSVPASANHSFLKPPSRSVRGGHPAPFSVAGGTHR